MAKTAADYRVGSNGKTQTRVGNNWYDVTDDVASNIKHKYGVGADSVQADPRDYIQQMRDRSASAPKADYAEMQKRMANGVSIGAITQQSANDSLANYKNVAGVTDLQKAQAAALRGEAPGGVTAGNVVGSTAAAINNGANPYQMHIDGLANARKQQALAGLNKSKDAALSNLNAERSQIQPRYYSSRNTAAAGSQQSARSFAEFVAARGGTRSGAAAQAELMRQGNLQGTIGNLNRQENAAYDDISRRTTGVNNAYEADVAAANAGIEADRMKELLNAMYQEKQLELARAGLTGYLGDTRTLAGQQFDWNTNPNNPSNVGQNLDNAYRAIQLDNLPQQLQQQAKLIEQQYQTGAINKQTAEFNLEQLRNPNSPVNQKQMIDLQLAALNLQNAPQEAKLRLEQLRKQIAQIGAAPYRSPAEVELDQVKLDTAKEQLAQLKSSASTAQTADGYFDVINNSHYVQPVYKTDQYGESVKAGVSVVDKAGLETFILSLGLSPAETTKLYSFYNIPIPGR